jgi:hypothetical protein
MVKDIPRYSRSFLEITLYQHVEVSNHVIHAKLKPVQLSKLQNLLEFFHLRHFF